MREIQNSFLLSPFFCLYDLAMMKLEKRVDCDETRLPGISICPNNSRSADIFKFGTIIGLGIKSQFPNRPSEQLMEAELIEYKGCGKHNSGTGLVNRYSQRCYNAPGVSSACEGDTGSPLVHKENGEAVCLIGISIINADRCDDPDYPSMLLSVNSLKNWMDKQRRNLARKPLKALSGTSQSSRGGSQSSYQK